MDLAPALPAQRPFAQRAALALLALAAIGAYAHACALGAGDFLAFHDVGTATLARGDIYAKGVRSGMYVFYVPHFSLVMLPLALLPPYWAGWIWYLAKLGATVLLARFVRDALRARDPSRALPPRWAGYAAIPFVLALNPINGDFKLGQVNLFVFVATLLAVASLERGRTWRAAILFSLALVKATPWVFLPWLVMRRQWRFLGALAVVGLGWLGALAAWFGPARVPDLFVRWLATSRDFKLGLDSIAYFENQSFQGIAARLATAFPALQGSVGGVPLRAILWVAPCVALFLVLLEVVRRDRFRPVLPPGEFAFVCLVMLFASPDSRWAHLVQLVYPLALLAVLAARLGVLTWLSGPAAGATPALDVAALRSLRWQVRALLGGGLVVLVILTRDLVGKPLDNLLRYWSLHAVFMVCVAAFLADALLRGRLHAALGTERTGLDAAP